MSRYEELEEEGKVIKIPLYVYENIISFIEFTRKKWFDKNVRN